MVFFLYSCLYVAFHGFKLLIWIDFYITLLIRYIYVDDYWRQSIWCNIAGILSTTSSEASVLFLCLITLDRLLVIKYPFGGVRITTKVATVCVGCAWLFSVFVALLPIAYVEYFKNEFYSKSAVCIALPLTRDRPRGWVYSLALFVGLNFVTFVLVAVGQLSIFVEIRKSAGIATSAAASRKRDLKVARNLLLVVATDFLCWFPIGVMGNLLTTLLTKRRTAFTDSKTINSEPIPGCPSSYCLHFFFL